MGQLTERFEVTGMHCPSCAKRIEMEVGDLAGVTSVRVDHGAGIAEVTYDTGSLTGREIIAAIIGTGYGARSASE